MSVVDVGPGTAAAFCAYARAHGHEHDDSYTSPEELARFDPAREPAAIARSADGEIVGAASLMVEGYRREAAARFRILHGQDAEVLERLARRVLSRAPEDVARVFLFLPEHPDAHVRAALHRLGFAETRRAYLLACDRLADAPRASLPTGLRFEPALPSRAAEWAAVVNETFRDAPGHYEMLPERAAEILARDRVLPDASLIAVHEDRAVGVVCTVVDTDDAAAVEVETLGVVPDAQARGVGRALLAAALSWAAAAGFVRATLSVAATNDRALGLYTQAGFVREDVRVCWEREIRTAVP